MNNILPSSAFLFIRSIFDKIKKSKLVTLALLCILGQGLYILLPGLLGILIDKIFVKSAWNIQWLILFPSIWLASVVFNSFGRFYISSVIQDVRKKSKEMIFQHIIHLPNSVYVGRDAGEVEHLMQELSFNSRYFFGESFPFFIRMAVTLIVSILIVSYSSLELIFVFIGWAIVFIPISYFSARKSIKHVSASLLSSAQVSAATIEVIENHELIPAFGTESFETKRFDRILEQERGHYNRAQRKIDATDFFQRLLQIALPICIAVFLIYSEQLMKMTPGSIASIFSFTLILTTQIGDFGKGILGAMEISERIKVALNKLECPIDLQPAVKEKRNIEPTTWDIRFENVSFSYGKHHPALTNINLEIKENEKVGIIGYSGAGKTTLIKLLRGFYTPNSGQIYIGGHDLETISPWSLTQNIAEVSQAIPIFHRSIRENVTYGCLNVSDDEIWEILRRAQIADYVKQLPEGLDTVVGVRGQRLSGGEKARIGIARALMRQSKIIIFDEATAALDSESELLIQKGLEELVKGRTLIAIAHRLSTLRKMESIIVLDQGQIVATGTHDELVKQNGLYSRLWNTQVIL
ncbi:MAG: ABC transporter ATP-binding protein [Verrucomicrobia bacterium]|nr:ABC transporter ATP-binding protein [Verrucomicrobiota bacterium]